MLQQAAASVVLLLVALLLEGCSRPLPAPHGGPLDCGAGVDLCGVLALQSGFGSGAYKHTEPGVHGLWPEVGAFGTSTCRRPASVSPPEEVYSCYSQKEGESLSRLLDFERHEWSKHGLCSGTLGAEDFFVQICDLAARPLQLMTAVREHNGGLDAMVTALQQAGFPVWGVMPHTGELTLSACAGPDRHWRLAAQSDFRRVCHTLAEAPDAPAPPPASQPGSVSACVPGRLGPACSYDSDCQGAAGCLRCARSGYCTDQPMPRTKQVQHLFEP